jgi:hypothetical protein
LSITNKKFRRLSIALKAEFSLIELGCPRFDFANGLHSYTDCLSFEEQINIGKLRINLQVNKNPFFYLPVSCDGPSISKPQDEGVLDDSD